MENNEAVEQPVSKEVVEATILSKHFHLPRVFLIIIVAILNGAVFGTIGYYVGLNQKLLKQSNQISINQSSLSRNLPLITVSPKPTIIYPSPTPVDSFQIYTNTKYNFSFKYPNDRYDNQGQLISSYKVSQNGSTIILHETDFYKNVVTGDKSDVFTIYDARSSDKSDLTSWWKTYISTDIGGLHVPQDYSSSLINTITFSSCIPSDYVTPPTLDVELKNPPIGVPEFSYYMYYNFGKPFIFHSEYISGGGCGGPREMDAQDLVYYSFTKLN